MVEKGQNPKIKIAIVAGEKSGDELGAPLMQSLKSLNPSIEFVGSTTLAPLMTVSNCCADTNSRSVPK